MTNTNNDLQQAETDARPETERSANAEAAKYRRQLREAEAERDTIRQQLEAMQRQQVTQMVSAPGLRLHDPEDLFRYGTELGTLLAEDGTVDSEKVSEAAKALIDQRPHLGSTLPPGARDAAAGASTPVLEVTWQDALRP